MRISSVPTVSYRQPAMHAPALRNEWLDRAAHSGMTPRVNRVIFQPLLGCSFHFGIGQNVLPFSRASVIPRHMFGRFLEMDATR
jgi:hypothetical protein